MTTIRVYEPALCCNTGVCGPDVDQSLVDFTAALNAAKDSGADVVRANLASDPVAFTQDPTALAFMRTAGSEGLPLTVVDGVTVLTGRYPSLAELRRWAGQTEPDGVASHAREAGSAVGAAEGSAALDGASARTSFTLVEKSGGCGCGSSGCC